MAPIVVSSTGISRQVIDDPELRLFLERLNTLDDRRKTLDPSSNSNVDAGAALPVDLIDGLTTELQRFPQWRFQEQVGWFVCLFVSITIVCFQNFKQQPINLSFP